MKLKFEYRNLMADNSDLSAPWEIYLRISADFSLFVDKCKIYEESLFPIVEFTTLGAEWLSSAETPRANFIYTSIESEDEGLVWIRKEGQKWRVGSVHQEQECPDLLDFVEIRESFESLQRRLRTDIMNHFRVDIDDVLAWRKDERTDSDAAHRLE